MPRSPAANLDSQLNKEIMRLCYCYTIARTDGVTFNFTDHSESLQVDITGTGSGALTLFTPQDGVDSSAIERTQGLDATNYELKGIVSSEAITETDILAGRFKNAVITKYLVDWSVPWAGFLEKEVFQLASTTAGQTFFEAQVNTQKSRLSLARGRVLTYNCRHVFGSTECGKDLTAINEVTGASITTSTLSVKAVTEPRKRFTFATNGGLDQYNVNDFQYGTVTFSTGLNAGLTFEIGSSTAPVQDPNDLSLEASIKLSLFAGANISVGDRFIAVQGCTKNRESCQTRFNNFVNYGGFPYMPNSDRVQQRPKVRQQ